MKTLSALILFLLFGVAGVAAAQELTVTEMAITTRIVKGNPMDSVKSISGATTRALYCFTRIENAEEGDTSIRHVWYRNDEKSGDYELPVKGKAWRTYSKKVLTGDATGSWSVEAVDPAGKVLSKVEFRIN